MSTAPNTGNSNTSGSAGSSYVPGTVFPALHLNDGGQCPNCLRKPLPYKRERRWFCDNCCRAYRMESGEQVENWAWLTHSSGFVPRHEPRGVEGGAGDHVLAKPSPAAIRRAARQEVAATATDRGAR